MEEIIFNSISTERIFYAIYLLLIVSTGLLLLYYWIVFGRLAFYKEKEKAQTQEPVSVVICAKNEYINLKNNLPLILQQDYPSFEVVVVNDSSDDDTLYLLKSLSEQYSQLKIVTIGENLNFFKGKKFPLSIGIKEAKNDLLLFTDADCKPKNNRWIAQIQSSFTKPTEVVLGYGAYEPKRNLLNKFIRFDTLHIAIQYLSFALIGQPYMGVGRNLAYRKSLFYRNKGFIPNYTVISGDDDLFINRVAKKQNTRIQINKDAHTLSLAKTKSSAWLKQKKRHLSTGKHYKIHHLLLLGLYSASLFVFYPTLIILLLFSYNLYFVLAILFLKLFSHLFIFKRCMIKLDEKGLLLLIPFLEPFFLIINPLLTSSNFIYKDNKWK